jgi:hypothetical protein
MLAAFDPHRLGGSLMESATEVAEGLWTLEGDPIRFLGLPYHLRTTVVRLDNGSLFVHSPAQVERTLSTVASLGPVAHLVTPNLLHHLFLAEWKRACPEAALHAPPGLRCKRPDLRFDADLGEHPNGAWATVLDQRIVHGSFFMDEVVFFHRESRTLILGDLIENHDPRYLKLWQRRFAHANRMLAPRGSTPLNYRLTFWRRSVARNAVQEILAWGPRGVIVMHGPCVFGSATQFLERAFAWLL